MTSTPARDPQVITADPLPYLLEKDDLPRDGYYRMPGQGYMARYSNSTIISDLGAAKGNELINETGRVDGWWVAYQKGSSSAPYPDFVFNSVVMYQSAEGAQLYMTKFMEEHFMPSDNMVEVEDHPQIGDMSRAFIDNQGSPVLYLYVFSYRNTVHTIFLEGSESEATPEFAEQTAKVLLAKLEEAPLSSP